MTENAAVIHARHMRKRLRLAKRVSLLRIAAEAAQRLLQHNLASDAKEILDEALNWLTSDVEHERIEYLCQQEGIAAGPQDEMVLVGYINGKFVHKMVRRIQ